MKKMHIGILSIAAVLIFVVIPTVIFGAIMDCEMMTSSKMFAGLGMLLLGRITGYAYGPFAVPFYMIVFAIMEKI